MTPDSLRAGVDGLPVSLMLLVIVWHCTFRAHEKKPAHETIRLVTQGGSSKVKLRLGAGEARAAQRDPTLLCCAYNRQRLYLFSRREPEDTEDAAAGRCVRPQRLSTDDLQL